MQYARTGAVAGRVFPRLSDRHRIPTLDPSQRRENEMTTQQTSRVGLLVQFAALVISATFFAACGSTSQTLSDSAQNEQGASVVRDPSNPHWVGSATDPGDLAGSTRSFLRISPIRDPENPYWQTSDARADTYADPVRGNR